MHYHIQEKGFMLGFNASLKHPVAVISIHIPLRLKWHREYSQSHSWQCYEVISFEVACKGSGTAKLFFIQFSKEKKAEWHDCHPVVRLDPYRVLLFSASYGDKSHIRCIKDVVRALLCPFHLNSVTSRESQPGHDGKTRWGIKHSKDSCAFVVWLPSVYSQSGPVVNRSSFYHKPAGEHAKHGSFGNQKPYPKVFNLRDCRASEEPVLYT